MAITNNCVAGRNMTRTRTINLIYRTTQQEIGFTDRPWNIQNFDNIILSIIKIEYYGLSTYCIIRLKY